MTEENIIILTCLSAANLIFLLFYMFKLLNLEDDVREIKYQLKLKDIIKND